MKEIFERIRLSEADEQSGYITLRYPVTGNKHIDRYYKELSEAFVKGAKKKNLTGMFNCRVNCENGSDISVITEARLYGTEGCVHRHRSGMVWDRSAGVLRYIRKRGKRRHNLICIEGELRNFD